MSVTFQRTAIGRRPKSGKAGKQTMPAFIEPCDPTLRERAPTGIDWVYEIKTDGYRAQVHIRDRGVTVYSRSGYDWTTEFAPIAKAASLLKVREAIIDGEATVLGNSGPRPNNVCASPAGCLGRPSQPAPLMIDFAVSSSLL